MNAAPAQRIDATNPSLIRIGGVAGLLVFGLHILINFVLIEPPPESGELETYAAGPLGATAIGHGLRYLAFFGLPFFAVGMYLLTGRDKGREWAIVGLLGATL